jgi:hypothetical protein
MGLRTIHLVFIVSSIALALMVALWGVGMYTSGRGAVGHLLFSGGSLLSAIGMAVYMMKFVRKTRGLGMD